MVQKSLFQQMPIQNSLARVHLARPQPAYQQLADALRAQILCGDLKPLSRLPSTDELAKLWQSSCFTVHTALSMLAAEGLIERRHGSGTYVAEPTNRFTCAGIYFEENIWSNDESAFARAVQAVLQARFKALNKQTAVFVDTRPRNKQQELLPSLAAAIDNREIQCLIAPIVNAVDFPALSKLAIPTAFLANHINIDILIFIQEGLRRLAAHGCRTVGLISSICPKGMDLPSARRLYNGFDRISKSLGLITHDTWVRKPRNHVREFASYGYHEFHKLWSQAERPDGLIVCYDTIERGVITAMLEAGVRVPNELKVVFHRNANVPILCPFPATWGVLDEETVADALIQVIDRQFKGEAISPIEIPFLFEETTEAATYLAPRAGNSQKEGL